MSIITNLSIPSGPIGHIGISLILAYVIDSTVAVGDGSAVSAGRGVFDGLAVSVGGTLVFAFGVEVGLRVLVACDSTAPVSAIGESVAGI